MKRISFTAAVTGCLLLSLVTTADAIDKSKTGTPGSVAPQNQFDPANLPGQNGLNNLGSKSDPFLPQNIYNPFPTLPGTTPSPTVPGVPNPRPGTYPGTGTGQVRINPTVVPPGGQTTPTEHRWRLGVLSRDTETGVQIHEVVRNSAAARAGLEPNDTIVAVHGHQVGLVNGELYELSREFEAHADQSGMITMLVQDNRSKTLMNITVQLDSRFSNVEGSVALLNNQRFPQNGIVIVELQEIVRQGAAPLTIVRKELKGFNPNSTQVPFSLEYDPAQVSHRGQYVLTANVINSGRSVYKTVQAYTVNSLGHGDGRAVAMRLAAVVPDYDSPIQIDQNSQIATIVKWFNEYLGRPPTDHEMTVWLGAIQRGLSLQQLQLELLGHNQFFNRCDRDKVTYITRIHQLLVGKNPSRDEMDYWIGRYDAQNGIRRELAREFQDAVGIRR